MAGGVLCSRTLVTAAGRWPAGARPTWRMLCCAPPLSRRRLPRLPTVGKRSIVCAARPYSTQPGSKEDLHTIVKNDEGGSGPSETREFQAETGMLLDIVAHSLYSEKEVFVRELVSDASDALEKLRYLRLTEPAAMSAGSVEAPLEIHMFTDKLANTFTIQDTGVGMSREEEVDTLVPQLVVVFRDHGAYDVESIVQLTFLRYVENVQPL